MVCLLEVSFELPLSCFAAKGIDGSDTTSVPDLQIVGAALSILMLLMLGLRTYGLSTLASSHADSISYCGLISDSLNAIATLVVFVSVFFCFSVCLLFLKQNDTSACRYSYIHLKIMVTFLR